MNFTELLNKMKCKCCNDIIVYEIDWGMHDKKICDKCLDKLKEQYEQAKVESNFVEFIDSIMVIKTLGE